MILQMPDEMEGPAPADGRFTYLMQFTDGNRIDLTIFPRAKLPEMEKDSSACCSWIRTESWNRSRRQRKGGYLPKPPEAKAFADCCNEFWWVCPYVAKGLWRAEITYAKAMMDDIVRAQLMKMLAWHIGVKSGFTSNPGKRGRYLQRYLEPETWAMLLKTYSDASEDHTWDALEAMCSLFRIAAIHVAEFCGFDYPHGDDKSVSAHLKHVRTLPRDAKTMY